MSSADVRTRTLVAVDASVAKIQRKRFAIPGRWWATCGHAICYVVIYVLLSLAVLIGNRVSKPIAEAVGAKLFYDLLGVDASLEQQLGGKTAGWRTLCLAVALLYTLDLNVFSKKIAALKPVVAEANRYRQAQPKVIAKLENLKKDLTLLDRDPQEVAKELQDLTTEYPHFFT